MATEINPVIIRLIKADGTHEIRLAQPGDVIPCSPDFAPQWDRHERIVTIIAPGGRP